MAGACDRGTPQIQVTTERTPDPAAPAWAPPTVTPAELQAPAVDAPRIVALDPPNGATEVDATRPTLAVTFDRAMDREGWSWVIEGPETAPDLGEATFDATARTNTVQARLQPGRTYVVWVNSPQYSYFRSAAGVAALPLRWTFTTRAATPGHLAAGQGLGAVSAHGGPPHVVRLDPPNGAVDVDPATAVLRATFDRPMEPSWSWVTEGSNFPQATGKAYFEADARTAGDAGQPGARADLRDLAQQRELPTLPRSARNSGAAVALGVHDPDVALSRGGKPEWSPCPPPAARREGGDSRAIPSSHCGFPPTARGGPPRPADQAAGAAGVVPSSRRSAPPSRALGTGLRRKSALPSRGSRPSSAGSTARQDS